uniref:Expansin-like EG45 domain-containing protein n=1 Tax=Quercus lobata TaxID=97700 RepID=A0A7N2R1E9_QUELO
MNLSSHQAIFKQRPVMQYGPMITIVDHIGQEAASVLSVSMPITLYSPPYSPTACYGSDASQFPSSNLFAAADDGIWNNGAACGRLYLVRCITSTSAPYACNQNQTIQIKIVGFIGRAPFAHSTYKATMVLSNTAFGTIANSSTSSSYINIEFEQEEPEQFCRCFILILILLMIEGFMVKMLFHSVEVRSHPLPLTPSPGIPVATTPVGV